MTYVPDTEHELTVFRTFEALVVGIEVMEVKSGAPKRALDIIKYLDTNEVLDNMWEATKNKNRVAQCTIVDNILYRRCISFEEAQYVLAEIHEGICSNHSRGKVRLGKVMRARYYWLHALKDVEEYMQKCKKCQEYSIVPYHPVGNQPSGPPSPKQRESEVRGGHNRLFHQVGRGRGIDNGHNEQHHTFSMEDHCLQV